MFAAANLCAMAEPFDSLLNLGKVRHNAHAVLALVEHVPIVAFAVLADNAVAQRTLHGFAGGVERAAHRLRFAPSGRSNPKHSAVLRKVNRNWLAE